MCHVQNDNMHINFRERVLVEVEVTVSHCISFTVCAASPRLFLHFPTQMNRIAILNKSISLQQEGSFVIKFDYTKI